MPIIKLWILKINGEGNTQLNAQGGGGVTIPGGVQEMFRCCTEGHALGGNTGGSWTVGQDDLRGPFQPWWFYDSMVLMESGFEAKLGNKTSVMKMHRKRSCLNLRVYLLKCRMDKCSNLYSRSKILCSRLVYLAIGNLKAVSSLHTDQNEFCQLLC